MGRFRDFRYSDDQNKTEDEELTEGTLRSLGAAAIFAKVLSLSKQIKRKKDVSEKLDLLASQNTYLAGLGLAVGEFLERSNR